MANKQLEAIMAAVGRGGSEAHAVLAEFVQAKRDLQGTEITIQPLIVGFRNEPHEKVGWSFDLDTPQSFLGHRDSLYEVAMPAQGSVDAARLLIDAIHAARALLDYAFHEDITAVPLDPSTIPKSRCMQVEDVVRLAPTALARQALREAFETRSSSAGVRDQLVWRLVPLFLNNQQLLYAALFLKASLDEYHFLGDEIEDAILANDEPLFVHDAVRAENAIHNAYKTIEAIWGGSLPQDLGKIADGLKQMGIDPDAMVGYPHHDIHPKQRLVEKVVTLRKARNEKAAHGRIHAGRKSTYYEVMDSQALARVALTMHIRQSQPGCGL